MLFFINYALRRPVNISGQHNKTLVGQTAVANFFKPQKRSSEIVIGSNLNLKQIFSFTGLATTFKMQALLSQFDKKSNHTHAELKTAIFALKNKTDIDNLLKKYQLITTPTWTERLFNLFRPPKPPVSNPTLRELQTDLNHLVDCYDYKTDPDKIHSNDFLKNHLKTIDYLIQHVFNVEASELKKIKEKKNPPNLQIIPLKKPEENKVVELSWITINPKKIKRSIGPDTIKKNIEARKALDTEKNYIETLLKNQHSQRSQLRK